MLREVGTQVQLSTVVKDLTGAAVNTPTLTMAVTKPDGTAVSPAPTVSNTGSGGVYTAQVTPDQAGLWLYRWTAAGAVTSVVSDQFTVVSSQRALVASMEEFKGELNRTDSFDDADLRSRLIAATDWAESVIGGPLSVQTFTEQLNVVGDTIVPIFRPLVSVISLTPDLGTPIDSTGYVADTRLGIVRLRWTLGWPAFYTLVYRAGLTVVSERIKEGGLIVAKHLWQTRNGGGGRQSPDELLMSGLGFAVPRRAAEMLAKDNIPGIA